MKRITSSPSRALAIRDIRPDSIDDQVAEAGSSDIEFLIKNVASFELRNCPACMGDNFLPFCEKSGFFFVQCLGCLSLFMNPAPNPKLLKSFYDQSQNYKVWGSLVYPLTQESRWETLHKRRSQQIWQAIYDFLPTQKGMHSDQINYLELGAGTGDTAARFKHDSQGESVEISVVEINPTMLEILSERSIQSYALDEVEDGSQHVIAAFEVLEHLLYPMEMMRFANTKLVPGGLFIFSTPNSMSLEVQTLKAQSTTLDQEHISVMSLAGLAIAGTKQEFLVRRLQASGQLDIELICRAKGISPEGFKFSEGLDWGDQKDISSANLSSNCIGIFQKT